MSGSYNKKDVDAKPSCTTTDLPIGATQHQPEPLGFDARSVPLSPERAKLWRMGIRKLDLRAVPPLSLLFLACMVDCSNVGNVKVAGLVVDLNLVGNQLSITLAIFYVTYIFSELPSNVILRKVGAKFWLPCLVFCWGIVTIGCGFIHSFCDLAVIRILLGMFEGGLLPGMPLYLSQVYPRYMVQIRIAYYYAGASLGDSVKAWHHRGVTTVEDKLEGLGGLAGWRWIFVIEGILTCLVALLAWWWLPESVQTSHFLAIEEREILLASLDWDTHSMRAKNSGTVTTAILEENHGYKQGAKVSHQLTWEPKDPTAAANDTSESERFEWREICRGLMDPQAWMTGIAYMCICTCLYSYTLFLPTILRGIYPEISMARLQLLTVPPFVPATVAVVAVSYLADRLQLRSPFLLCCLPFPVIGYAILLGTSNPKVNYAAVFLIAFGIYPSVPYMCVDLLALPSLVCR
ncbi:hypothetical protein ACQY0O_006364 [Thecaphora frezii]